MFQDASFLILFILSFENCFNQNPRKEAACCQGASGDETKKQQGQATAFHVSEGKFQVKLIKLQTALGVLLISY